MKSIKLASVLVITALCLITNLFAQSEAEKEGREIFEKYQAAIGGKENLAKIKTIEIKSETERTIGKTMNTEIEDRVNKKNYTRTETAAGRVIEAGSDGTNSWLREDGRALYINVSPESETLKYKKLQNERIDGKEYLVVEEIKSNSAENSKGFYDPATFLLARREKIGSFNGESLKFVTSYSDYRQVGDVLVPFMEVSEDRLSGKKVKKILSVKHNLEISPSIFEMNPMKKEDEKPAAQKETEEVAKAKTALEATGFNPADLKNLKDPQQLKEYAAKNTIYQDENGKEITEKEFEEKIESGNFNRGPGRIGNGKVTVRLRKNELNIPAPDFTGALLDGSTVQLSSLKGKVVVLNFWFTACAPCIKEMPELNELVKQFQSNKDVLFYSVTYNTKDEVAEFFKKHKFDYQAIVNAENILETFKNPAYPTHIVIDRKGKILLSQLGYSPKIKEKLIEKIETALKSAN